MRIVNVLILVGVFLVGLRAAHGDTWTLLAYMAADNNLEPFAVDNVTQMTASGPRAGQTVVLQIDRNLSYSQQPFPGAAVYHGTRRFALEHGGLRLLEDLGAPDGSRSSTLADFVAWGLRRYPADHYALLLWDHGFAWQGCCEDESANRQHLSLDSIAAGVSSGLAAAGVRRLDLIAFDQCLMSEFEVALALSPWAKVFVASADMEPASGFDYAAVLDALAAPPNNDPAAVGTRIADAYAQAERQAQFPSYTLSVLDLDALPALATAVDALAGALLDDSAQGREPWPAVARASAGADHYGGGLADVYGLVDLGGLAARLAGTDGSAQTAAAGVATAVATAVRYAVAGPAHAGSSGLSIHLPERATASAADYDQLGIARTSRWGRLVQAYAASRPACSPAVPAAWAELYDGTHTASVPAVRLATFWDRGAPRMEVAVPAFSMNELAAAVPAVLRFSVDLRDHSSRLTGAFTESAEHGTGELYLRHPSTRILALPHTGTTWSARVLMHSPALRAETLELRGLASWPPSWRGDAAVQPDCAPGSQAQGMDPNLFPQGCSVAAPAGSRSNGFGLILFLLVTLYRKESRCRKRV